MKIGVIIVAAGSGTRMGGRVPKQFLPLAGVPVLVRTLRRVTALLPGAACVVALAERHIDTWGAACRAWELEGTHTVCTGGATRFESVQRALARLPQDCELIAVHDGVRPFLNSTMMNNLLDAVVQHGAAIPVVEVVDSLRRLTREGSEPVDRAAYRAVQTPQIFRAELLRQAYARPFRGEFTDDASVVEALGHPVALVAGGRHNIKITAPEDFLIAEAFLAQAEVGNSESCSEVV